MKNVLITGGANGIGYECASIFADDGNNVYVIDIDQEEIEKKQKLNKKIKFYCCDVSNYKKMEEIAEKPLEEYSYEEFDLLWKEAKKLTK